MYDPEYNYSDKIVTDLVKTENAKTVLHNTDLSYEVKQKVKSRLKSLDLFHLAHMLELDLKLSDAEKISKGKRLENVQDERIDMLTNFRNVLEFNRSDIADTYAEFDTTILNHIHKLSLTSWRESWEARYRNSLDKLDKRWDNWLQLRDSKLDNNREIEEKVNELIEWYKISLTTVTPVLRIAILIYRLIELAPFIAGNKLTILGIADYIFLKNGLASKSYQSVIQLFDANEDKLIEAHMMSSKNFDLEIWIETFCKLLSQHLVEARKSLNEYIAEDEKAKQQPFLDLSKRQLKVLRYLQTIPYIKREDYCQMMEVSTMTAFRDLKDLVKKGLLKIEGQGRGTKYRLASM